MGDIMTFSYGYHFCVKPKIDSMRFCGNESNLTDAMIELKETAAEMEYLIKEFKE